ncbi:hypothetical protein OS493_006580 [Desmophyllum pertusum]|uniref:Uncharacterized protein n=1 Tax=Desmophyllum pertusum TaxID=174260 RepID=A0A9X0A5L0_9CNID|nr:hypothetical protein OS493_006580 [Desmophyllum pertusum]
MAPGVSMDEDFVYKVSVVLLCFLCLLWVLVMFLIFWLGKIHHRVDSISKGWNAYCILASHEPQAVDSETNSDWKHMNRAFAYGPNHSDEDEPCPNLEETASVSQGEDRTSVDGEEEHQ